MPQLFPSGAVLTGPSGPGYVAHVPVAFFLVDFWDDRLVAHDRQWVFLVLLGLLLRGGQPGEAGAV